MPLPTLYSKDSVDNLLADKLDLAGGTMTGGLTLSATGIIFSDATTLTTAPAGSTLAADQLTAGVVATNPAAGPTTAGDVLQYDGTDLIWAAGGGGTLAADQLTAGVVATNPAAGPTAADEVLTYDGTDLVWATPTAPDTAADQLTNGTVTTNPAAGPTAADEVLTYDGTDLVWAAPVVAWGGVTGTLSSQTDLQTELDGKLPVKSVNSVGSYTLASGDTNNIVATSSSNTITVPQDSTYSFPTGTVILVVSSDNSGTIVPEAVGGSVSPSINNNSTSINIGWGVTLVKIGADSWAVF